MIDFSDYFKIKLSVEFFFKFIHYIFKEQMQNYNNRQNE